LRPRAPPRQQIGARAFGQGHHAIDHLADRLRAIGRPVAGE
jgi:hypothetical protein